jgi:hypothetical protein
VLEEDAEDIAVLVAAEDEVAESAKQSCATMVFTQEIGSDDRRGPPSSFADLRSHELDLVVAEGEPIDAMRSGLEIALVHRPVLVAVARPELEPEGDWQNSSLLKY